MYVININENLCEGCPVAILSMEDGKATVSGDPSECMGCESCVATCPHEAITVTEM
ncbi:MAG: 4Fe-4S binding protein [Chloroflexota bacterium]